MNNPTIDQMNEAIALFMEVKPYEDSRYGMLYTSPIDGKTCFNLQYHSSWDWLMPVVAKIPKLIHATEELKIRREMPARWKPIENELCNVNLTNVHYCVYRFIQWYKHQSNEQPK